MRDGMGDEEQESVLPVAGKPSVVRLVLSVVVCVALAVGVATAVAVLFLDLPNGDVPLMIQLLTASGLVSLGVGGS